MLRLGAQGWNYDAWIGPFYPDRTRATDFLRVYSRAFDTVEVDSTFYAIPSSSTVKGWVSRVPRGFQFALKLPQEITHERRLRHCTEIVAEFEERARELGDHLGPILIQMGPSLGPSEAGALDNFLGTLDSGLRYAVEFRDRGWITPETVAMLRAHGIAMALTDARWVPRRLMLAMTEQPTADFSYIRWMGPDREIVDYSRVQVDRSAEIDAWVRVLPGLQARVKSVYAYVNNHFSGHSPATLRELQRRLQLSVVEPESLGEQMTLF